MAFRFDMPLYITRQDTLHQWYKPRYRTQREDARTLTVDEIRAIAAERGAGVVDSLLHRRTRHV